MPTIKRSAKKVFIAIIGSVVVIVGIIAIPYPGPGWLIVFTGLAILATEFAWARKVLERAKSKYNAWANWLKRQHGVVRLLVLALTGVIIVTTLWLLNCFGLLNGLLHLPFNWVVSPLFK